MHDAFFFIQFVQITAIYTDYLKAFPKEITQVDNQLVLYTGSMLVGLPYSTTTQSTSVHLGSKEVRPSFLLGTCTSFLS
ncbi:unnamed protein product [Choristocarpus tenellus]